MWGFAWQNLITRPSRTALAVDGLTIPILASLGLFSISRGFATWSAARSRHQHKSRGRCRLGGVHGLSVRSTRPEDAPKPRPSSRTALVVRYYPGKKVRLF